jgi:hypothetical protein
MNYVRDARCDLRPGSVVYFETDRERVDAARQLQICDISNS